MTAPAAAEWGVFLRREGSEDLEPVYQPQPKQLLLHTAREPNILYGGAAGGMKSHGLRWHMILACLKHPNFHALLLRRQFTELEATHILKLRTEVPPALATYNQARKRLEFDDGSILQFGHCNTDADFNAYLSTEWDAIGVDEAVEFTPYQLRMLPSRLRTTDPTIRPQFLACTNPGGVGHHYLKSRFLDKVVDREDDPEYRPEEYRYIPALVTDNPYLDDAYLRRLRSLPKAQREAYLYGNWDAFVGQVFSEWRSDLHVTPEDFRPGAGWEFYGGMDWGYRNPGCFLLFAVSPGAEDVVATAEIYFKEQHGHAIGLEVGYLCQEYGNLTFIAGDEQMWYKTGQSGPTIAEEVQAGIAEAFGRNLAAAPKLIAAGHGAGSRATKLAVMHRFLEWTAVTDPDGNEVLRPWGRPRLRFHPRCRASIRTIPALPYKKDTEDVDTDAEDHAYDAAAAFLMTRPEAVAPRKPTPAPPPHRHPGFSREGTRREAPWERTARQLLEGPDEEGASFGWKAPRLNSMTDLEEI